MKKYLNELARRLEKFEMTQEERAEIIADYEAMIDDALAQGLSEVDIEAKLGDLTSLEAALKDDYNLKVKSSNRHKYVALSPFVAIIIFFLVGFLWDAWHPGWIAFLLIPLSGLLFEGLHRGFRFKLTAMMPFITVIAFILIGTILEAWHPAWLLFLLIPTIAIIESGDEYLYEKITGLSLFFGMIAFVLIGYFTGVYAPTWLLLLLPLFLGAFESKHEPYRYRVLLALIVSVGLYIYLGLFVTNWVLALLAFTIYLTIGLLYGHITIVADYEGKHATFLKLVFVMTVVLFLLVGYTYNAYGVSWLFLLMTPIVAVALNEKDRKASSMSPFIAVIGFVLLGYFLNIWYIAWLVFLIIPMTAIIEDR